jgi:hypothetical protein
MPTTSEILGVLTAIANDYIFVAIGLHILIYISAIAFAATGAKLTNRTSIWLLSLLPVLVALFSWLGNNPFNGILFSLLALSLILKSTDSSGEKVRIATLPFTLAGIVMLLFGLWYPHFVIVDAFWLYLIASPTGLIPCPTLSVMIGLALIFGGFRSNPLRLLLLIYGFFYSLFGMFKLGVYLDVVLLAGTIVFFIQFLMSRKHGLPEIKADMHLAKPN